MTMMLRRAAARITNGHPVTICSPITTSPQHIPTMHQVAFYFTNGDAVKRDDPYATLGLTWGSTISEIKSAYKNLARELHPDVNLEDTPEKALKKFQNVQLAYSKLMDVKGSHRDDLSDEWSFQIWRHGDIIAQERKDVAGVMRKRPSKPAQAEKGQWGVAALGHPSGGGNGPRSSDFLGDGSGNNRSGTVGSGRNKWVKAKEFKPWNPDSVKVKKASVAGKNRSEDV